MRISYNFRELFFHTLLFVELKRELTGLIAVPRASPRACKHAFTLIKTEKRVQLPTTKERGGIGGLCKEKENPALPPKWPRSGVTFQFNSN